VWLEPSEVAELPVVVAATAFAGADAVPRGAKGLDESTDCAGAVPDDGQKT